MTDPVTSPSSAPAISAIRLPDHERTTGGATSRWWGFLLKTAMLALIIGGIIVYRNEPQWLQEVRGIEYETVVVSVKDVDDVALSASGYVVPYRMLNVSPRVPGTVTKLTFEVGQKVKQGDLLAQLDDTSVQADLEQAEAAASAARYRLEEARNGAQPEEINQAKIGVTLAESKLDLVQNELERAHRLSDSTTAAELDQLASARKDAAAQVQLAQEKLQLLKQGLRPERLKVLEADLRQAEALVTKARYYLENTRILAPLDGTVLEKNAEVGEILRPEVPSVSLCRLADMSIMEVEVDVQERELQKIEIGRACTIIPDAYTDRKYTAKVNRLQPMVIRARGVVRVTIRIDEPDQYLLPEMNVRATVHNPESSVAAAASLWLPEAAVIRESDNDETVVYVLEEDVARRQPVQLGAKDGRKVEVTSGVRAGDLVVLPGTRSLRDGQAIRRKSTN